MKNKCTYMNKNNHNSILFDKNRFFNINEYDKKKWLYVKKMINRINLINIFCGKSKIFLLKN